MRVLCTFQLWFVLWFETPFGGAGLCERMVPTTGLQCGELPSLLLLLLSLLLLLLTLGR